MRVDCEVVSLTARMEADTFDAWWPRYPRRVAKADARKAWHRMTAAERLAAMDTIGEHVAVWIAEGRGTSVLPYPATWLNRKSWEDELNYVAPRAEPEYREAPGMAAVRRAMETT